MTSRERVRAALNHQPTDMLPIDFGAMRSTGISIVAYDKLKKYLGISDGLPKLYDVYQYLAEPEPEVLERMGGDVVQAHRLCPSFGIPITEWKKYLLPQGVECLVPKNYNPVENADKSYSILNSDGIEIARMPSNGLYFDATNFPFKDAETIEDIKDMVVDTVSDEELDFIENEVKYLYENTDKAILLCFGGNILESGENWFGFEHFMELLLTEEEMIHFFFEKLTEGYLTDLEKILSRVGKYIDVIQFGDDLGTQINSIISPDTYRKMIKPYHKKQYRYVQENYPNAKVFLHSCGAIAELIPDLIDAGVQVLNPVQISAAGMDPQMLKDKFSKDIVFWGGGANMQETVLNGSIEEIKSEVSNLIDIFSKDSGFIFNQVHNIQANVSPEKIMAIYDTALSKRNNKI